MAAFNDYDVMNCTDLYPARGISDDWLYGEHHVLAYTFELGTVFVPPVAEIAHINAINVPGALSLIEKCGALEALRPNSVPDYADRINVRDGIQALELGRRLLPKLSGDHRETFAHRLCRIGHRVARVTADDLLGGQGNTLAMVRNSSTRTVVLPLIRTRLAFEQCHGNALPAASEKAWKSAGKLGE